MDFSDSAAHAIALREYHNIVCDFVTDEAHIRHARSAPGCTILSFKIFVVYLMSALAKPCMPRAELCEHQHTCLRPGALA